MTETPEQEAERERFAFIMGREHHEEDFKRCSATGRYINPDVERDWDIWQLATINRQPVAKPSAWRPISDIPDVPSGDHREFILAWESLKDGKRYSGPAFYLNEVELEVDFGFENVEMATGWFEKDHDIRYDESFTPLQTDGIRLLAWTVVPAPPAEGDVG